ncbi:MAG: twitching motility protein PilT [Lachnospiraceae bacterium]
MVECIVGRKGKGKTKHLLEKVRIREAKSKGSIVYLDKSSQHIYELSNSVRLIDMTEYPIETKDTFIGFICGIISQDHDLEVLFLDSFLKISHCEPADLTAMIEHLKEISQKYNVDFVLSISADKEELPEEIYGDICVSL